MTATAIARLTRSYGPLPTQQTYPIAASINLLKGTIVTVDSSGRADVPTNGQDAVGVARADYVNAAGGAGAFNAEVDCGVFSFAVSGTAPQGKGEVLFVVDNQTVSLDDNGGVRGVAGFCVGVDSDGQARVLMGPAFSGAYADVAAVEADATQALAETADLKVIEIPVPMASFRLATGAAGAAWTDGSVDGFNLADSEGYGIRHNPSSSTVFWTSVKLPDDLDDAEAIEIHFMAARIGSADATAALTVTAFRNRAGAAYDAGADLSSGDTGAIDGATKVLKDVSVTLTGALAGDVISFSFVPTAALDADDSLVVGCWIAGTRAAG